MSAGLVERVAKLDGHFRASRPRTFELELGGALLQGRFVHAHGASELYGLVDVGRERLATIAEVVTLRLAAFDRLMAEIPEVERHVEALALGRPSTLEVASRAAVVDRIHAVWRVRLTTATHMVRATDERGADTVFFFTGSAFQDSAAVRRAFEAELSDGGIRYDEAAVARILAGTPATSRLPYATYLAARGGNFFGADFARHPIFRTAVGDEALFDRYVYALSVLNLVDFYNPGLHSGWRPGEMKPNYGRPVALGYKGEAFYPPNNSTVDHSALVLPLGLEVPQGAKSA